MRIEKSVRFITVVAVLALLMAVLTGVLCHAESAESENEQINPPKIEEVKAPELSYHSLRYHGGLVTRMFGKFYTYTYDQPIYADIESSNVVLRPVQPTPFYEATLVLCCLVAYLLGSVNFATIISGRKYKDDVRNHGSGNAGMTNMLRTYGKKAALWTLLGDVGKAIIAVLIGLVLVGDQGGYFAGMFCIFGHAFPLYYGFKGGKGVACTAAVVLMLEPIVFLILLAIFIFVFLLTKYVSLSAIMAMLFYPVLLSRFYQVGHMDLLGVERGLPLHVAIISVLISCFVIFLHRGNIKRLYNREERKTELFKKKKKEQNEEKI